MATRRYITTVQEWQDLWDLGVTIYDCSHSEFIVNDGNHPDYLRANQDNMLQGWIDNKDYYILEE